MKQPKPPPYRNSAGRLLRLVEMLTKSGSYLDQISDIYGGSGKGDDTIRGQQYLMFMQMVVSVHREFLEDLASADAIPEATKAELEAGLSELPSLLYPPNPSQAPRGLQPAETSLLKLAGSLLTQEEDLLEDDREAIRKSVDALRKSIDVADLPKSVRTALLEIVSLSTNALDQYLIYGAKGFKVAFKRMLAELMEVYASQGSSVRKESWWQQTVAHVDRFEKVTARLLRYRQLAEAGIKMLLGDGK